MHEVHETLSPGAVVAGRYLIVDLLGKGGDSAVYLVKDLQGEESFFALKEASSDHKKSSEHFTFECRLLERLSHPALPRVHEVFANEEHTRLYMLMDYVEGPNLETLRHIQHEQRFSLAAITSMLAPVVDAIAYLHQQDPPIVHRDIKPSNMIVPVVEKQTVLVDFGIAKEHDAQGTTSAVRYGSHGYGAPEQYSAGTNTRTDIYGLAATLYTLLTGEVPADALERMTRLSNDHPDPLQPACELNPSLPAHASEAIGQALAINMRQRFATVQEFWQALQAPPVQPPLGPQAASAKPVSPSAYALSATTGELSTEPLHVKQVPERRARKRSLLLPILLGVLLLVGVGASYVGMNVFRQTQVATPSTGFSTEASQHPAPLPNALPTVASSATFTPNLYPRLSTSYAGTIVADLSVPPQIRLLHIQQNNGFITGFFSGLEESASFSGFITPWRHLSFFVAASGRQMPLSFIGDIRASGEIDGTFCAIDQSVSCIPDASNGAWSVTPV
jgi:serine/threonine protein kinase